MQNYLIQTATDYFSTKFGSKVQIASVDLELFNKVLFKGVYIEDLRGDTLLYVNKLKMGFSPLELLQNRIVCNYIEVNDLTGHLVLDKKKVLNLSFILDALKKDKTKSKLSYQLEGIKIINSRISYINEGKLPKSKSFDANNIHISNLNAEINLHKLTANYLSLEIEKLGFEEKSGLILSDLSASITANKRRACINDLAITLPHSEISFTPIMVSYGNTANLKQFSKKAQFEFMINPSKICLSDLKAFAPALSRTHGHVTLSSKFKGNLANMKVKNLAVNYNDDISLRGNFELIGLPRINETFIYAKIKDIKTNKIKLQDFLSNLAGRPIQLPEQLTKLGTIHFKGNVSGLFSDMVVYGSLKTDIGQISTDILMGILPSFEGINYSGSFTTKELKIGNLFDKELAVGDITFNLSSKGTLLPKGNVKGDIEGTISSVIFKNYSYKNILLKGVFDKKVFDGWVDLDDEYAKLNFNGKMDFSEKLPSGKFRMIVRKLNLNKLNLIKEHPNLTIAFNVKTSFIGSKIEDTDTDILIDSLYLSNKHKEFFSEKIYIQSTVTDSISILKINSDLVKGTVKGTYSFLSLGKSFRNLINYYLPSLRKPEKARKKIPNNDFVFYLTNFHVNELADILNLNLTLSHKTLISGFYNDESHKFRLEIIVPELKKGKNTYKDLNFLCNNQHGAIHITSTAELNKKTTLNLDSRIANDSVLLSFDWRNPHNFSGKFSSRSLFSKDEAQKLQADIEILPSQIWVKDSLWDVHPCTMKTDFKSLHITNFALDHKNQYIKVNGIASASASDSLFVKLKDVELNYIMNLAKVRTPIIEGLVTGDCLVMSVFNKMILQLDISAKDFTFNHALWGDVKMKSKWDDAHKKLLAKGFALAGKDTAFHIGGEFYPKNDSLEFYADINKLKLNFLRYYLDGALKHATGDASGRLHIFGGLKNFLLEGDIFVKNGKFDVDFLKTSYHFTDTIFVKKDAIIFDNITLYDFQNHKGQLSGRLTHKNFKDMRYRFDVKCNNVLAMKTVEKDNPDFYGTAFGTGTVRIVGDYNKVDFTINMKTMPNTKVVIPMVTALIATENSFIQYVAKPNPKTSGIVLKNTVPVTTAPSKTHIHVYLQLEATPEAEIKLITDPVGGDMVRAEGNGDLRIDYDNIGDIKLYGIFEVERGDYIFTLQQVVRKNFAIKRGGTIRWSGDPYEAIIDLDATYTVPSVSLLDILEETDLEGVARTSMPINCLLNLTGDLMQPTIKFDLELPSSPELQERIKRVVITEEMMNREILALLVMNRFYKPDYLQSNNTGLGTEMVSVLTTTVSGQLNNWLSKINDKVNIGIDARMGNGQDFTNGGEYKIALNYQPNNRLIINSNLGYRDDVINPTPTNFIGDVDVEYKLNRSGKFRAKAYTHSADNFFISASGTAKTTQGVGIMYREDYNKFSDVVRNYFNRTSKKNDSVQVKPPKNEK